MLKNKKFLNIVIVALLLVCLVFSFNYIYNNTTPCFNDSVDNGINLPIIMYHHMLKSEERLNDYTISPTQFEKDIVYLKENGYETISMNELLDYFYNDGSLPEKPIMITFDDGHESFYEYALPILEKYDYKAIVSIVGSFTDTYTESEDHNINYSYLTWQQVNELADSEYVEIGNHTYDLHSNDKGRDGCKKKSSESVEEHEKLLSNDILKLQEEILNYTGYECNIFTYPFGKYDEYSQSVVKDLGFSAILTCSEVVNKIDKSNPDILYSLGRFNRPNGISTEQFFQNILN